MEVRDLRQVRSLPWWGIQSIRTIFFFFLHVHMQGGVPHQGWSASLGNLLKWGESSPSESCRVG